MSKVLLVEDDEPFAEIVCDWLEREKYVVEHTTEAVAADELMRSFVYDVIILDWSLQDGDGVELCKSFRARGGSTPILLMTGKGQIPEKEQGLDAGADDYLTKPVNLKELSARIRALLRRVPQVTSDTLSCKDLVLDSKKHLVTLEGEAVDLLPKEFLILEFLLRNRDQVFSTDEILNRVWRSDSEAGPETVRSTIKRLRKKIDKGKDDSIIQTIYGVGYKIEST